MPTVLYPFPYVAMHIEQTPTIGRIFTNLTRSSDLIAKVRFACSSYIAPGERRLYTCPTCILPFGFTWQPVRFSCLLREPSTIGTRIMPGYVNYWMATCTK